MDAVVIDSVVLTYVMMASATNSISLKRLECTSVEILIHMHIHAFGFSSRPSNLLIVVLEIHITVKIPKPNTLSSNPTSSSSTC